MVSNMLPKGPAPLHFLTAAPFPTPKPASVPTLLPYSLLHISHSVLSPLEPSLVISSSQLLKLPHCQSLRSSLLELLPPLSPGPRPLGSLTAPLKSPGLQPTSPTSWRAP